MKKKLIFIGLIIIILTATTIGVVANNFLTKEEEGFFKTAKNAIEDKKVVAIVNNQKVYQHQIDFIKASQELSRKNAELSGYDATQITIQSQDEILSDIIRKVVVLQEAKAKKLTADYSEAQKYVKENYNTVMATDNENSRFLKDYLEELNLSENEYLKKSSEAYQYTMTRENFYNAFVKEKTGSSENIEKLYEEYVEKLVDNAEIIYK